MNVICFRWTRPSCRLKCLRTPWSWVGPFKVGFRPLEFLRVVSMPQRTQAVYFQRHRRQAWKEPLPCHPPLLHQFFPQTQVRKPTKFSEPSSLISYLYLSEASSSTLQKSWIWCKKAGFQQKSWISAAHGQKTWISVGAHCVHPEIQVFYHLVLQKNWISCKK